MNLYKKQGFWSNEPQFNRNDRRGKQRNLTLKQDIAVVLRYLSPWPFGVGTLRALLKCRKRDFLKLYRDLLSAGVVTRTGIGKKGAPHRLRVDTEQLERWATKIGQPTIFVGFSGNI